MEESPFGGIDEQSPELQREFVRYLDALDRSPTIQRVRSRALAEWRLDHPHRLLDVGAGAGEVARELAGLTGPDGEVIALDSSQAMIDAARARDGGTGVRYVVGDVRSLPYGDGYFDGVRTERVLQHLEDPDAAIAEMSRVLRPGGRICLIDTDWDSLLVDGSPADMHVRLTQVMTFMGAGRRTGRTLRRRLLGLGYTDVQATPVTVATADHEEASVLLPVFDPGAVRKFTEWGEEDVRTAWVDALERAVGDGTFLATLTIWVATGTKP
nr:methyltransferase domain-containing protein [uncultured Actinoplanes sp.]